MLTILHILNALYKVIVFLGIYLVQLSFIYFGFFDIFMHIYIYIYNYFVTGVTINNLSGKEDNILEVSEFLEEKELQSISLSANKQEADGEQVYSNFFSKHKKEILAGGFICGLFIFFILRSIYGSSSGGDGLEDVLQGFNVDSKDIGLRNLQELNPAELEAISSNKKAIKQMVQEIIEDIIITVGNSNHLNQEPKLVPQTALGNKIDLDKNPLKDDCVWFMEELKRLLSRLEEAETQVFDIENKILYRLQSNRRPPIEDYKLFFKKKREFDIILNEMLNLYKTEKFNQCVQELDSITKVEIRRYKLASLYFTESYAIFKYSWLNLKEQYQLLFELTKFYERVANPHISIVDDFFDIIFNFLKENLPKLHACKPLSLKDFMDGHASLAKLAQKLQEAQIQTGKVTRQGKVTQVVRVFVDNKPKILTYPEFRVWFRSLFSKN